MEEKEGLNGSGVTLRGDEASQSYRVEPRVENPGSIATLAVAPSTEGKKKRGRPRKYGPDGSVAALSPMPISASIPLTGGDYSAWKRSADKPVESSKKKHKLGVENTGGSTANSAGGSFIPHLITVNPGEDVSNKIISFSQQGSRAICILAANGAISNVTLRQHNSSSGTLTYEGRFEILSLTGLFMPSDNGLAKSRSGGMSVSLAGADGRVLGGGLAGMLVAASSVQVVIASFLTGNQPAQKRKKPKHEHTIAFGSSPSNPVSEERHEAAYTRQKPNLNASVSFHADNMAFHGNKITSPENNVLLSREDSREQSHEITC